MKDSYRNDKVFVLSNMLISLYLENTKVFKSKKLYLCILPSDLFRTRCAVCRVAGVLLTNCCCGITPHPWVGIIIPGWGW